MRTNIMFLFLFYTQIVHARPCGHTWLAKFGCAIDPTNPGRNGGMVQPVFNKISEQAFAEAGANAMIVAANIMYNRNGASMPLDEFQKSRLRPTYGGLVDQVSVVYDAAMMNEWAVLGKPLPLIGAAAIAQTYCSRIYLKPSYELGNYETLQILAHELRHSQQCVERGGMGKFGFHYMREYYRAGFDYASNVMERDARAWAVPIEQKYGNMRHLMFLNTCNRPVRLGIQYFDENGIPLGIGWWNFRPLEQSYLQHEGRFLWTPYSNIQFYAQTTDNGTGVAWTGNVRSTVMGREVGMVNAQLNRSEDVATFGVNCR